jgi:hypothetical protein
MIKSRTSGAKALIDHGAYGTAEPVPFVESVFAICLSKGSAYQTSSPSGPSTESAKSSTARLNRLLKKGFVSGPDFSRAATA